MEMILCSIISEKNGNKHMDRQTNRHTNIGFTKKNFSTPVGPIPILCPNFMEISSLVSEKNSNKQTYIQTNKQKRENKQTHKHRIYKKKQKKSFSAPAGPIPTLCPNFMEISSLVSEKNKISEKD